MITDDVEIRLARADDAVGIADVHTRSWQQGYAGLLPADFLARRTVDSEVWRARLAAPEGTTTIVAANEDVIGFCTVGPLRPPPDGGPQVGQLYAIYLLAEHWGRGVGRALHDAGLQALADAGYVEAVLWVLATNERTIGWYRRQGWEDTGTVIDDDCEGLALPLRLMQMRTLAAYATRSQVS